MVNPMRREVINLETENALDCSGIFKIQEDAPCQKTI
ncbi:MAG: hypothetical protein QOH35_1527 [Acidobacteriaceae bacterium]|jgi:hypothetical protein|nr:hypothetical protein [Acidobacteriaceae bacterium]MDX6462469.1 hypothetical protein [Acidobacteriaceae bacterium]MEA2260936.1 hypothetical protein [Acidobacteriaceae bacterium]MEA2540161.1 hypothetical protein [Acidobacteriaceae bacterium]